MKTQITHPLTALLLAGAMTALAQTPQNQRPPGGGFPPGGGDFGGPPGGGFDRGNGGPGGGPGMAAEQKIVEQFDQDGDHMLNRAERTAAREFLNKQGGNRRGPGGGGRGGFGGPGGQGQETPKPGAKLAPAEVKSFGDAPLYAADALRTFFLEFDSPDWEKELAAFKNTDVEVPAKLTVDGKIYPDVGVHFHGNSSYFSVGEGSKRSLVLSLDYAHGDQQIGGYSKLSLLNSHEDPSFLRTVLSLQAARDYLPAPQANFARVVINGESWGIYVNQQHFNKDFTKDWFKSKKGARWKVPGSPNGRGGLNYLGEDVAAYKRIYEIKSKDDPKAWADFIHLCKVLRDTPADQLESALAPLLDVDSTLRFLAWDNVFINGDGFWTRASDYDIYEDENGRFHIIPYDANETFSTGGGPGGGRGGPGGRGSGPGGMGPGGMIARQMLEQADKNRDQKLGAAEFAALADDWFDKMDAEKTGQLRAEQFTARLGDVLGIPAGGEPGGPGPGRGNFGAPPFAPAFLAAVDANRDGALTRPELKAAFAKWSADWDADKTGSLTEENIRNGLNAALPRPNFAGPGGGQGGPGGGGQGMRGRGGPGGPGGGGQGMRGRGGPGGPGGGQGIQLNPLVDGNDTSKPLLSKLLAVPALRTRYLHYVGDMAGKWLDWNKLGPVARQYQALISDDVKADTRKLESFEDFARALQDDPAAGGGRSASIKSFAEKRRAYLLGQPDVLNAK